MQPTPKKPGDLRVSARCINISDKVMQFLEDHL